MLHTFILICGCMCMLNGKLDCFPISRLSPDLDDVRSAAQSTPSSNSLWTFPVTGLYSSHRHEWIFSTSLLFLIPSSNNQISSSNDPNQGIIPTVRPYERRSPPSFDTNGKISLSSDNDNDKNGISSSYLLSSSFPKSQVMTSPSEFRPNLLFDKKSKVSQPSLKNYDDMSTSSSINNCLEISSPSSEDELRISTTSSYAMQLSNYRFLKSDEFPMILFDGDGEMHTNYYPPAGHSIYKNKQNK
ncbi:uncharacterized protein LOC112601550 [Melanaphis sacchari]|uniref:uncharacterized protein LOC112601550 n=1 Tax=Melanaphis sacchari TaxID=742174 RepID=UPI000DC13D7E|nr:uncharacterized protein LOC112601550 [Melanaphis sacchari]